jgi:hypothetical protein
VHGPPAISLPKGGGALRGIGEKFAANPATGSGAVSIPIPTGTARGFAPQLSLAYDSGAGNGPFGFGWTLALPAIARKTDKGLPRYIDDGEGADVFILSGAEDLVPALLRDGTGWKVEPVDPRVVNGQTYAITRYRPRTEGAFARIERWTNVAARGDTCWRSITRDNVATWYGRTAASRIAAPDPSGRIFSWLISESYDDRGNAIVYDYGAENDAGVATTAASEQDRDHATSRYLRRIRYGNRTSRLVAPDLAAAEWLFELVFDYDEGYYADAALDGATPEDAQLRRVLAASRLPNDRRWAVRPDPFSSYRSRFEVRTYRRCRRVLMFHRFDELGPEPYLVRATEFEYSDFDYRAFDAQRPEHVEAERRHHGSTRVASFIQSVTQSGFVRDDERDPVVRNGARYLTYLRSSLPPLEFEYSRATISEQVHEIDASALENLPAGIDGAAYQLVDLDGEGAAGILSQRAGAWHYKRSRGNAEFEAAAALPTTPASAALGAPQQLLDLAGDGQLDVVSLGGVAGFFERTHTQAWAPFQPFRALPNVEWNDPNLRFIDLSGDGRADALLTEDDGWLWFPSRGEEGFGEPVRVPRPPHENEGPLLVFADPAHSIYIADMCGDGLAALVRVRNGEVCYWPNLGYGGFGAKVTMDNAPWLDEDEQFDGRRVRLADIDGSGTTDLIYLARGGARLYFNQAGNRWSGAHRLDAFPAIDNAASMITADLLGNGTACLVWSSPLAGDARRAMRYVDLMGGTKPHLLVRAFNNLGAETIVGYVPSTKFYFDDKAKGIRGSPGYHFRCTSSSASKRAITSLAHVSSPVTPIITATSTARNGNSAASAWSNSGIRSRMTPWLTVRPTRPTSMLHRTCRRCTPRRGSIPAPTSMAPISRGTLQVLRTQPIAANTTASPRRETMTRSPSAGCCPTRYSRTD